MVEKHAYRTSLQNVSRKPMGIILEEDMDLDYQVIQTGALLRMAEAFEAIAKNVEGINTRMRVYDNIPRSANTRIGQLSSKINKLQKLFDTHFNK